MIRLLKSPRTLAVMLAVVLGGAALAQYGGDGFGGRRGGGRRGGGDFYDSDERAGVPMWENAKGFEKDVFTFVRVIYGEGGDYGYGRRGRRGYGRGGGWGTDWPESDYNLSYRLQQLTSLKVSPWTLNLSLTDPRLFDYPFIYMIEPGNLYFTDEEVVALRKYLLAGGFLMVDDFWGDSQYQNFYEQIKRVFPDREVKELPIDHEIFRIVYPLKDKPQMPSVNAAVQGRPWNITWEEGHDGDTRTVHYKAIFDDKGRMMTIICHNTDLGDGWEEEGTDPWYFTEFAEKKAYPMGINIIVYAMTH
jgi:hypothetical protein